MAKREREGKVGRRVCREGKWNKTVVNADEQYLLGENVKRREGVRNCFTSWSG